jgi:tRNA(fMet)-specific endonuclease VapC
MNGSNYLLDTNIVVGILNQEPGIARRLNGRGVYISATVLGELYFGAQKSARIADNLRKIEDLIASYRLLACDEGTAIHYGQIRMLLRTKGRPIPENDIWIAAVALQHGLRLVTRDEHFKQVDDLVVEKW